MKTKFVKEGIFLFFILTLIIISSGGGNFLEKITGKVIFQENETERIDEIKNLTQAKINISKDNLSLEYETNFSEDSNGGVESYVNDISNLSEKEEINLDEENISNEGFVEDSISLVEKEIVEKDLTNNSKFGVETKNISIEENEEEIEKILGEEPLEIIVGLKEPSKKKFFGMVDKSDEEIREEKEEIREEILEDLNVEEIKRLSSGGFALDIDEDIQEELELDNRIAYIEPVRYFSVSLSEATEIINSSSVWAMNISGQNLTGRGQTICVIDTGINYSHPDLIGRNATTCNLDCIDKICVENCSVYDLNGHGTHVAGIATASGGVIGVAPEVNYIGLKVFPDSSVSGATTTGIKNAIDWCVDNFEVYNISVITMSLGTSAPYLYENYCDSDYPSFNESISNAFIRNISVTISSGNGANTTSISSPACISRAIPVADSYDANVGGVGWGNPIVCSDSTTEMDKIVCHANRNSLVQLLAPGALINSTWYDGTYSVEGGTSMAAPMVAGSIAIVNQFLKIVAKNETPQVIENRFYSGGKIISDGNYNFSRIDIYETIENMKLLIKLNTPGDENISSMNETNFSCNGSSVYGLKNVTFNLWNSSELIFNESFNFSGYENSSEFNYTFTEDATYYWNCFMFNENNESRWSENNFSFVFNSSFNESDAIVVGGDEGEDEGSSGGRSSGGGRESNTISEENLTETKENKSIVENIPKVPDEEIINYSTHENIEERAKEIQKNNLFNLVLGIVVGGAILFFVAIRFFSTKKLKASKSKKKGKKIKKKGKKIKKKGKKIKKKHGKKTKKT